MKKVIVGSLILFSVFMFLFVILLITNKNNENINENFEWKAKYIWLENDGTNIANQPNTWMCFRKQINIENRKDIKDVIARIAVDSKYWLYINDEIVIREGGVKRGEKPNSIYYDEVDITEYLKKGNNTISILVWYFGKSGFSHIDSGQGALLFQAQIGNETIISDDSWKVIQNPAYLKDSPSSNGRLSEASIYYDANLEIENWYKEEYNDNSWKNAYVYGDSGDLPWGELIVRDIPQFIFSDIKEYENSKDYRNYTTSEDELITMELPYNMQITPYLKVESKENKTIYISLDENYNEVGKDQRTIYVTKEGIQEFESIAWINGEKIYYYIPAGVKIISLGYRETGYDSEKVGKFVSDDEMLNTLWEMASRTLYVNMRDNYMDCPDRERALWWGDNSVSMQQAMYAYDTNANKLFEKAIKSQIGWKEGNLLMTVIPSEASKLHLPVQSLLGITAMYDFYEYVGNRDFLAYMYPHVKEYLNAWTISQDTGLADINNYYALWKWGDSAEDTDYSALENICYYYALNSIYKMAQVLGSETEISEMKTRVENFAKSYNEKYWKENGYKSDEFYEFDVRVNTFAILSGLADNDKKEVISKILIENTHNSTFMEKYVLEALCETGKIEDAQNRIKTRYKEMIESQDYSSTLWEYWDKGLGSKNHAWAGGPLIIMSKYFAGIEPLKPGYNEISIKPNLGNLNSIDAVSNTPHGEVKIKAEKNDKKLKLNIDVPIKTRVGIEKMSENPKIKSKFKTIYFDKTNNDTNKIQFDYEDENYVYFYVDAGKYKFVSK